MTQPSSPPLERIDKWLWHARLFKTRTLATQTVKAKKVRINGVIVAKPAVMVKAGDILTFSKGNHVKIIEIVAIGTRRGPAPEAQALYKDLSPEPVRPDPYDPRNVKAPSREQGMGRPTKADRRAMDKLRDSD